MRMVTEALDKLVKRNRRWAILIGTGVALSPIHNRWLTHLVTGETGEVEFFLPAFGTAIWLMSALLFLVWSRQKIDWGEKRIFIPLAIIVASMGISGFINEPSWQAKLSPLLMGTALFALYLAARILGKDIFLAFIPFTIIGITSVVISGILSPGQITGGFITNYNAAAGYLVFGALVVQGKWQWVLVSLALIALFFVGALEGLFIASVLGIIVLTRRDWNKRLLIPVGVVVIILTGWIALGHLDSLWGKKNIDIVESWVTGETEITHEAVDAATTGRWINIVRRMSDIQPFGHGYWITMPKSTYQGLLPHSYSSPEEEPVHNVPLVIVDQVGPLAGLAWLFVALFCLVRTRWKYVWIAILAMSVFDHYIWTQFAPYWWVLVGVSTVTTTKNDYIFRRLQRKGSTRQEI